MNGALLLLALLAGAAGTPTVSGTPSAAAPPATADAAGIPIYTLVRPELALAGQPPRDVLAKLKDLGFRTVVNLRTEREELAQEERAIVEGQGLRYVSVPVTTESFSAADVEAVAKVLGDREAGPVLLHCATANRAGGMLAAVEALQGRPLDEAIADARKAGLKSDAMVEAVRRVAARP